MDDWMQTYSGNRVDLPVTHEDQICIFDILHHISLIARFGGATIEPWTVGHHTLLVCELVKPGWKLEALLHDAHEAYVGDMRRPVQVAMRDTPESRSDYDLVSTSVATAIACRFDIPVQTDRMHAEVKKADNLALAIERECFLSKSAHEWGYQLPTVTDKHRELAREIAEYTWTAVESELVRVANSLLENLDEYRYRWTGPASTGGNWDLVAMPEGAPIQS